MVYPISTKKDRIKSRKLYLNSNNNLNQVVTALERNLKSPAPSSFTFIWRGERQNRKAELDTERQQILLEQLNNSGDFLLGVSTIQALINKMPMLIEERERALDRAVEKEEAQHNDEMQRIYDEQDSRQEQLKRQRIKNELLAMRKDFISEKTAIEKTRRIFLKKLVDELDLQNINPIQAILAIKLLKPDADPNIDNSIIPEITKEELKKYMIENKKMLALAEREVIETNKARYVFEEEIREDEDDE